MTALQQRVYTHFLAPSWTTAGHSPALKLVAMVPTAPSAVLAAPEDRVAGLLVMPCREAATARAAVPERAAGVWPVEAVRDARALITVSDRVVSAACTVQVVAEGNEDKHQRSRVVTLQLGSWEAGSDLKSGAQSACMPAADLTST